MISSDVKLFLCFGIWCFRISLWKVLNVRDGQETLISARDKSLNYVRKEKRTGKDLLLLTDMHLTFGE